MSDFDFAIEIARERAVKHFGGAQPEVVATLAQTFATLALAQAIEHGQSEIRDGLNYLIDAAEKAEG
jgi:hypothetical protein